MIAPTRTPLTEPQRLRARAAALLDLAGMARNAADSYYLTSKDPQSPVPLRDLEADLARLELQRAARYEEAARDLRELAGSVEAQEAQAVA